MITLRDITADNWHACIDLEVMPGQEHFVASNVYSLAQAGVQPECVPRAVYCDDTMIGFLMYEFDPANGDWWIFRLMIDRRYQGRGLGRATLLEAIRYLRLQRPDAGVSITLHPDNEQARHLYLSVGFEETGTRVADEDVLSLPARAAAEL